MKQKQNRKQNKNETKEKKNKTRTKKQKIYQEISSPLTPPSSPISGKQGGVSRAPDFGTFFACAAGPQILDLGKQGGGQWWVYLLITKCRQSQLFSGL